LITIKFCKEYFMSNLEIYTFETYKQFFEFYMKHKNKGCIYGEKDDGLTK